MAWHVDHRNVRLFDARNLLEPTHDAANRFGAGHRVTHRNARGFEHCISAHFAQAVGVDRGDRLLGIARGGAASNKLTTSTIASTHHMHPFMPNVIKQSPGSATAIAWALPTLPRYRPQKEFTIASGSAAICWAIV